MGQKEKVVSDNRRIMQTMRHQALRRAIGELNAALEASYPDYDEKGAEIPDELTSVIQECIKRLEDTI